MLRKRKFSLRMENSQCGSFLKKTRMKSQRTIAPFFYCLFQAEFLKFESLLYDSMFEFFNENCLILQNQAFQVILVKTNLCQVPL